MKIKYLFPWFIAFFIILMTIVTGYAVNNKKQSAFSTSTKAAGRQQFIPTITPYNVAPVSPNLSLSFWLSVLNRFPDTQKQIKLIEALIPDPIIRSRIAEVLISNNANLDNLGRLSELYKVNRVIGHTLCGDSRVICDTMFTPRSTVLNQTAYYGLEGGNYPIAIAEQRSLGAAPRVYNRGVNISIVSVHCNSITNPGGCGALAALEKMLTPEGRKYLLSHGVDASTLDEIARTIQTPNAIEQAKLAAKVQAKINWWEHGRTPHVTVATEIGHADKTMTAIGAYDEMGRPVAIPQVVQDFIALNNRGIEGGAIDDMLLRGQAPFEYVLDASGFNIQDLMGTKAAIPGHTFKITLRPQGELPATMSTKKIPLVARIQDVDQAISGINYPLAHDWGRLQWILGRTPEETALIRERMLMSDPAWKFLGRKGVIVEAVVDSSGKMSSNLRITKLADVGGDVSAMTANSLRVVGADVREVALSTRSLAELERSAREAGVIANETNTAKYIRNLKTVGRVTLNVMKVLGPILDGISGYFTYDWVKQYTTWNIVHDIHNQTINKFFSTFSGYKLGVLLYNDILSKYSADPYLLTQSYNTSYSRKELANSYMGLVKFYGQEVAGDGLPGSQGNWTTGSTNPNSEFYGVSRNQLYKILVFDVWEKEGQILKKFTKENSPLIFFPIEVPEWLPKDICANDPNPRNNPSCYPHYDDSKIPNSEMMILNTNTGEFLATDSVGEMIVAVKELSSVGAKIVDNNLYYFRLTSDGKGNISILPVAYKR